MSSPLADRASGHADHIHRAIRYGSKIVLEHPLTSRNLHSHELKYYHSRSSRHQSVSCAQELDENDCWIVIRKACAHRPVSLDSAAVMAAPMLWLYLLVCVIATKANRQVKAGDIVFVGDSFRLVHAATRALLHTHRDHPPPSALLSSWQEVTAFGLCDDTIDTTDSNDIWKLVAWRPHIHASEAAARPMTVEAWKPGASVALYHVCTGAWLSSHFHEFHIIEPHSPEDPRTQQQVYADALTTAPGAVLASPQEWCVISVEPADLLEIPMNLLSYSVAEWESAHRSIAIRFGHQIVLTDNRTHATLHSHRFAYTRPGSSGAQQVTGSSGYIDANDFWIVMPTARAYHSTKPGDPVVYGTHILLMHASTGAYLYTNASHLSSRHDGQSLEVSCRPYPSALVQTSHAHRGTDPERESGEGAEECGFRWRVEPDAHHRASASWRRGEHFSLVSEAFAVALRTDHVQFDVSSSDRQQVVFGQPTARRPVGSPATASRSAVWRVRDHVATDVENESAIIEQMERRRAIQLSLQAQLDRIEQEEREAPTAEHLPDDESESDSSSNQDGEDEGGSEREEEEEEEEEEDDNEEDEEYGQGSLDEHSEVYEEFFHIFHHHDSGEEDPDGNTEEEDDFVDDAQSSAIFSGNSHRQARHGDWRVTYARPAALRFLPADFASRVSSSLFESAPPCYSTEAVCNKHVE